MTSRSNTLLLAVGLLVLAVGVAQADMIIKPVGAAGTNVGSGGSSLDNTINDNGLSFPLDTGTAVPATIGDYPTHGSLWSMNGLWAPETAWHTGTRNNVGTIFAEATFDLGASYNLSKLAFWNYNEFWAVGNEYENFRGIAGMNLSFSADGSTFADAISLSPARSPDSLTVAPQLFDLHAVDARYVKVSNLAHFAANSEGWGLGIAEVRFVGATVPEPSAIVLCGTGILGMLAYAWRKRR